VLGVVGKGSPSKNKNSKNAKKKYKLSLPRSHEVVLLQIITYAVVGKKESRTKENFIRTMMQALELQQLVKRHISG